MKRRSLIKSLLVMSGGILFIPSCIGPNKRVDSVKFKNFEISPEQESVLMDISETILPSTDTPGAKTLALHMFALKMLDDCYEKGDHLKFFKGLEKLEESAKENYGHSFMSCSTAEKECLLEDIEQNQDLTDEKSLFYNIIKQRLIQGYLNSKYVMTNLLIYRLIPDRYNGYFPVENLIENNG